MKKLYLVLFLIFFANYSIFAQDELYQKIDSLNKIIRYYQVTKDNLIRSYKHCDVCFRKPKLEIKYDIGSHFEMYSAVQVAVEHSLPIKGTFGKLFRLQHTVGFISDDVGLITTFSKNIDYDRIGFRYRLEPRFYKYIGMHKLSHFFYGPSLTYRYTIVKAFGSYIDETNSYTIDKIVTQNRHHIAFNTCAGWWFRFGKSPVCAELSGGIGVGYNIVKDDIPINAISEFRRTDYFGMNTHASKPYYSLGGFFSFKIGYIIKK